MAENTWLCIALIVGSYLLGSIPWAYIFTRFILGVDVRDVGSGNVGFTNAARAVGWKKAIPVFICDMLKGCIPTFLGLWLLGPFWGCICGLAAVLGHIFPIFLNFKGGKGVLTSVGALLVLVPRVAIICLAAWGLLVWATRYVSLASILASVAAPILCLLFHVNIYFTLTTAVFALIVCIRHIDNMKRLLKGTERNVEDLKDNS